MKNAPYYIIAVAYLALCVGVGGTIAAGSSYIKQQARMEGTASALIYLQLEDLGRVDIRDL